MRLDIDYVSDMHLNFYIKNVDLIEGFFNDKVRVQVGSNILVIAGDISEDIDMIRKTLEVLNNYYEKIIYVVGNHEYYIPNMLWYKSSMGESFNYKSINKIYKLFEICNDCGVILLDHNNSNHGIYRYNDFLIAGDTLWYKPKNILDWVYYYPMQSDSMFIMSELSKRDKIIKLHDDSMKWYDELPRVDLMISHIPPLKNSNNGCYYNDIDVYKANTWIYGHDHKERDIINNGVRFVSNPWGYESKDFKIKKLTLEK